MKLTMCLRFVGNKSLVGRDERSIGFISQSFLFVKFYEVGFTCTDGVLYISFYEGQIIRY